MSTSMRSTATPMSPVSLRRATAAHDARSPASRRVGQAGGAGAVTVLGAFDSAEALELEMRRRRAVIGGVEPTPGEVLEKERTFLRKNGGKQAASYGLQFKRGDAEKERKVVKQRHTNATVAAREKKSKGHWDNGEVVLQEAAAPPSAVGAVY